MLSGDNKSITDYSIDGATSRYLAILSISSFAHASTFCLFLKIHSELAEKTLVFNMEIVFFSTIFLFTVM